MKLFNSIKNIFIPSKKITAKTWKCLRCGTMFHSEIGREIPSPCRMCGSIGFEKVN